MAEEIIEGKTFLITGGASGLGLRYAEAFLEEGAKGGAILDVDEERGKDSAEQLNNKYNKNVVFVKCDVSDEENLTKAFDEVIDVFKQVDIIINNAGIMNDSPRSWRKACEVNWEALVSLTLKGVKQMSKDEGGAGGTIINISSIAALFIWPFLPIYSGSKMAVLHFSHCLAQSLEGAGIRVMSLCPGPTDTALMTGLEERAYSEKLGNGFANTTGGNTFQKVESAVKACVEMMKKGENGSTWVSNEDRPPKNVTKTIHEAFALFTEAAST